MYTMIRPTMNCARRPVPGPSSAAVISTMAATSQGYNLTREGSNLTNDTNDRDNRESIEHHAVSVLFNGGARGQATDELSNKCHG